MRDINILAGMFVQHDRSRKSHFVVETRSSYDDVRRKVSFTAEMACGIEYTNLNVLQLGRAEDVCRRCLSPDEARRRQDAARKPKYDVLFRTQETNLVYRWVDDHKLRVGDRVLLPGNPYTNYEPWLNTVGKVGGVSYDGDVKRAIRIA